MILRKYFLVIMIGFALNMAFVTPASAAFGFGSCCSGYPCGTIPCDSGCAGKALSSMGTDVSSSANDADSAYDSLTDAIETVDESFESLGDDVVDSLVDQKDQILEALSASTNRIELAETQRTKALQNGSDFIVNSLRQAMKEVNVAESTANTLSEFSQNSQPESTVHMAELAPVLKTKLIRHQQYLVAAAKQFEDYISGENSQPGKKDIAKAVYTSAIEDDDSFIHLLSNNTVNPTDFKRLLDVLTLAVIPDEPVNEPSNEDSVEKQRYRSMQRHIYASLLSIAMLRLGSEDLSWIGGYNSIVDSGENVFSEKSLYYGEINGRLTDDQWWASIKTMNSNGLHRELASQETVNASIKYRWSLLQEKGGVLDALISAKYIHKPSE